MSIGLGTIMRDVQTQLRTDIKSRSFAKLPMDYKDDREAMIDMHTQWQTLMAAVRLHNIPDDATRAAIKLAATAIKFATDLGSLEIRERD